jgi:hypothetical protein
VRYPDPSRFGSYATELRTALKRRKQSRKPRVRVRIGHAEPRILNERDAQAPALLGLARELADACGSGRGGASRDE